MRSSALDRRRALAGLAGLSIAPQAAGRAMAAEPVGAFPRVEGLAVANELAQKGLGAEDPLLLLAALRAERWVDGSQNGELGGPALIKAATQLAPPASRLAASLQSLTPLSLKSMLTEFGANFELKPGETTPLRPMIGDSAIQLVISLRAIRPARRERLAVLGPGGAAFVMRVKVGAAPVREASSADRTDMKVTVARGQRLTIEITNLCRAVALLGLDLVKVTG